MSDLSTNLSSAVEQHGPSVVRVEGRRWSSSGLVFSAEGHVITTHHTLDEDERIEVGLADGKTIEAALVGRDPGTDLALLKVEATGLAAASFGTLEGLRVGHLALALARPGKTVRATLGIVSALGDADGFRVPGGAKLDRYVETDVHLKPGFDGGPLVDLSGHVLGLNTRGLVRGSSLAVPASTIRRVAEKLIAHGGTRRAYLGLGSYPVRLPPRLSGTAGRESALLVVSVQPDGPSDKAGVLVGDVLLSLDGQPVHDLGDLLETLGEDRADKALTAHLLRAGQPTDVVIQATARE